MPNRLANESSPYLLQHANNPVDWHPWSDEAIAIAKQLDRPIFLSIGYSACHWCHVMEHESFESETIARQLNDGFVSIKVDREERPDLDQIYMTAVQMMTGRGGWPMTVFLTPELKPFYCGTYFPPESRYGMPGFPQVLSAVVEAWKNRRDDLIAQADDLTKHVQDASAAGTTSGVVLPVDLARLATASLERNFDHRHGGFGGAPKFPHPMDLRVMLRAWQRNPQQQTLGMVTFTLDKMAGGGIYDQLGGGFHRYSVDDHWLVPHFEKMLYDNALLTLAYLESWQATGRDADRRTVCETLDYVLREMTDPSGGFYSTQDADSEGVEGKFYVWTPAEIELILGVDRAKLFCQYFDVSPSGNFEHANILNRPKTLEQLAALVGKDATELAKQFEQDKGTLLNIRNGRTWPGLDDKVLVSWNGLMIDAMAQAGAAMGEMRYVDAAVKAAEFILRNLRRGDGRLLHTWRHGRARFDAYLDDYACFINTLVSVYEATFAEHWIDEAVRLADLMIEHFADRAAGGFFYTADDHEQLISRQKDIQDSSTPSGNAMAATALLRLGHLCGRADYLAAAESVLQMGAELMQKAPAAAGQLVIAADLLQGPTVEWVLVGNPKQSDTQAVIARLRQVFRPNKVIAFRSAESTSSHLSPLFKGRAMVDGQPTLYICEQFTCQSPIVGRDAILAAI